MKKHAAEWSSDAPTPAQLKEFFAQCQGLHPRITRSRLQDFLNNKQNALTPVPLKYDKTNDGWTRIEHVEFYGQPFIPDLVEFLKPGESSVYGEVMKLRAKEINAHLGQGYAEYLLDHQDLIHKKWRGKYFLIFPGTVWRDSYGNRRVPFLGYSGSSWFLGFDWLGDDWHSNGLLVCLRNLACR